METLTITRRQISSQLYMGRVFIDVFGRKYNNFTMLNKFNEKYSAKMDDEIKVYLSEDKEVMIEVA